MTLNRTIYPPRYAIKSMQDSGYKNAAYALAELMDNSIQADATNVELICLESTQNVNDKNVSRVSDIAVLDNGIGMDYEILGKALQFGNGSRADETNHKGIGKFGMGLPSASISQADRVEIWSWQDGVENALWTYLDAEEIKKGDQEFIPDPTSKAIPKKWIEKCKSFSETGTLVVWTKLSRCNWKRSEAIIKNSESIIGRLYRYYLSESSLNIRFYTEDNKGNKTEKFAVPNDPLYLMENTSTPEPFKKTSMFNEFRKPHTYKINYGGETHEVVIKSSITKKEAIVGVNRAGNLDYGQHAKKNMGISIVRANRELDLDKSLCTNDFQERWWGIEISFGPELDEVFGVTNDKQHAKHLRDLMASNDLDSEIAQMIYLKDDGDPRYYLLELIQQIQDLLKDLRDEYVRVAGDKKPKGPDGKPPIRPVPDPEDDATDATDKDDDEIDDENVPLDERIKGLIDKLIKDGYSEEMAKDIANFVIESKHKYLTVIKDIPTPDFFLTESVEGILNVTLNTRHKAFKFLEILNLDTTIDDMDVEELRKRAYQTVYGVKLMFYAWALMRHTATQSDKNKLDEYRIRWGMIANKFFFPNED